MGAAGKWKLYDIAKKYCGDGTFALPGANWKVALYLSTSNANTLGSGTIVKQGDITNEVAAANGYSTGGAAVTTPAWSEASGTVTFDADDVVFNASGGSITARFAVLYNTATLNGVVKPVMAVCLLDATPADVTVTDGNPLTIQMNVSGIWTFSGANTD